MNFVWSVKCLSQGGEVDESYDELFIKQINEIGQATQKWVHDSLFLFAILNLVNSIFILFFIFSLFS